MRSGGARAPRLSSKFSDMKLNITDQVDFDFEYRGEGRRIESHHVTRHTNPQIRVAVPRVVSSTTVSDLSSPTCLRVKLSSKARYKTGSGEIEEKEAQAYYEL